MSDNIYETQRLVDEYLLFHYGTADDIIGWSGGPTEATGFPERVARYASGQEVGRALDIGASVGRSSYVLAEVAEEVVGIDFSQAFIDAAQSLQAKGSETISRLIEGVLRDEVTIHRPEKVDFKRICFQQGDAMNLPEELGTFDRVLAANLICRLPEPERFLNRLPSLVSPDGVVVLATPCTWLEEFTPPANFPTGETLMWLKQLMSNDFELLEEANEPFLIRETARKFQWTVSQVTVWKRK